MKKSRTNRGEIPKSIHLPETILKFLTHKLIENPPKFRMDEKIAKFYLHVLFRKVISDWKNEAFETYYPLCSEILDDYTSSYKKYFDYFVENEILEKVNHKNFPGQPKKCASYRFSTIIRNMMERDAKTEIVCIDMSDITTRNTVIVPHEIAYNVKNTAKHLSKWLDENLTIDYDGAQKFVKENKNFSNYQKISYLAAIENLNSNNIYASRNQNTDNRIHSNLSNLPKALRPFVHYDGENLVNYDIKSSQPYFMVALVEFLMRKNSHRSIFEEREGSDRLSYGNIKFNRIIDKRIERKSLISQNLETTLYSSRFQDDYKIIKKWILEGVFYIEMMRILYPNKPSQGRWERKVPKFLGIGNDGQEIHKIISKYYTVGNKEEEKAMVKESVFSILYGGAKNPGREFKDFKKHFPAFSDFLLMLKENDKRDFPILLQQIESTCVLDYVTKEIAKKHPNMPLFTIHDSIATTESFSQKVDLQTLVSKLIKDFTGVPAMIEEEFFCTPCLENN